MSRRLSRPVSVECDGEGTPLCVVAGRSLLPIRAVVDEWREWFGALSGEPERDVWVVDTPQGVYELHRLIAPADDVAPSSSGQWLLDRAED